MAPLHDDDGELLYTAGETVPAGHYTKVDASYPSEIILEVGGPLPPSFDGHVAMYRRREKNWHLSMPVDEAYADSAPFSISYHRDMTGRA